MTFYAAPAGSPLPLSEADLLQDGSGWTVRWPGGAKSYSSAELALARAGVINHCNPKIKLVICFNGEEMWASDPSRPPGT